MKIIILGAGRIGGSLAIGLAQENHEITLVDLNDSLLQGISNRVDLRTLRGHGAHPNILAQAGAEDADMLVALTAGDEVNMVACQVAYSLFKTPLRIARVRAAEYLRRQDGLFAADALPIDVLISPEQVASRSIQRLIRQPGVLRVIEFAEGLAQLAAVRVGAGAPAAGRRLAELHRSLPKVQMHVAAVYRGEQAVRVQPELRLKVHDEVFVLAASAQLGQVIEQLRTGLHANRHVLLAGGGNVGGSVAAALEGEFRVKLIERDARRVRYLSEQLADTLVLHGDATDENLMVDENLREMDVFCALTDNDEANILSAMQAKRMGADTVIALINRPSYVDLVGRAIDITVSPQQATISELLTHIRRGDVLSVHSLRRGTAEALEAKAHSTANAVGRPLRALGLPDSVDIGALVRGKELIIPDDDAVIEPDDRVILFVSDKRCIRDVERLFQVSATFF